MAGIAAELALPDVECARRGFEKSAATFARASVVHDEARRRLLDRLAFVRLEPQTVIDLGCGHGAGALELARTYPNAGLIAIDTSRAMLGVAAERLGMLERSAVAVAARADAACLPLRSQSVDLILANLILPWSAPHGLFAEAARVLAPGGLLLFSTLGPDTLAEVRRAWARVDDGLHVHAFFDMHDIGDLAVRSGLAEPVLDVDRIELSYRDVPSLVRDLRASGATNVAAGRRKTLTGCARWRGFEAALASGAANDRFGVTVELILGQAWGAARGQSGGSEVTIPAQGIPIRH
jgi:malonyl-CoA O-methyltransferase